jgi:hypothetical protein
MPPLTSWVCRGPFPRDPPNDPGVVRCHFGSANGSALDSGERDPREGLPRENCRHGRFKWCVMVPGNMFILQLVGALKYLFQP